MALKNRRTQNKKSNKKRQQSKRGGTRKSVKKNRITVKRGGTSVEKKSVDERITKLEGQMENRKNDIRWVEGRITALEQNMPIPMDRLGSSERYP